MPFVKKRYKKKTREEILLSRIIRNWKLFTWTFGALVVIFLYLSSPFYSLTEAVYWEAVEQTSQEQLAIRWVIANRKDVNLPRGYSNWGSSFWEVILDGEERGNNRDFTYRHHQDRWWLPDRGPILPVAHAWRHGNLRTLATIQGETVKFLFGYWTGLSNDPTQDALFYKVTSNKNNWFQKQISQGILCNPHTIDAHTFYGMCMNGYRLNIDRSWSWPSWLSISSDLNHVPVSIRGTNAAVEQAYQHATGNSYRFFKNDLDLWIYGWYLKHIQEGDNINLKQVSYPYLQTTTLLYLTRLAEQYKAACNESLTVTSALRPLSLQEVTAGGSEKSVHPTGLAFDLSVADNHCQKWLQRALIAGETRGYLQVTREQRRPHWHVVVYPKEYNIWLEWQNE
jgi:hypothetical protein